MILKKMLRIVDILTKVENTKGVNVLFLLREYAAHISFVSPSSTCKIKQISVKQQKHLNIHKNLLMVPKKPLAATCKCACTLEPSGKQSNHMHNVIAQISKKI